MSKVAPWSSWAEFHGVYLQLTSSSPAERTRGVRRVETWTLSLICVSVGRWAFDCPKRWPLHSDVFILLLSDSVSLQRCCDRGGQDAVCQLRWILQPALWRSCWMMRTSIQRLNHHEATTNYDSCMPWLSYVWWMESWTGSQCFWKHVESVLKESCACCSILADYNVVPLYLAAAMKLQPAWGQTKTAKDEYPWTCTGTWMATVLCGYTAWCFSPGAMRQFDENWWFLTHNSHVRRTCLPCRSCDLQHKRRCGPLDKSWTDEPWVPKP